MPKQNVIRARNLVVSAVAVMGIATGGYAVASLAPPASATNGGGGYDRNWKESSGEDAAMVVSAVEMYQTEKGATPGTYKVTNLDVSGDYARGKVMAKTSDPTSTSTTPQTTSNVFYAVKEAGEWKVVYSDATTPPPETSEQLKLPSSWRSEKNWEAN